jgi:hypothetical protein
MGELFVCFISGVLLGIIGCLYIGLWFCDGPDDEQHENVSGDHR